MGILPRLRQGQQALQYMLKGNIYYVSTDWDVCSDPYTGRVWYHNRRLDTSQWEFPIHDCAPRPATKYDELPTGWQAYTCETEDGSRRMHVGTVDAAAKAALAVPAGPAQPVESEPLRPAREAQAVHVAVDVGPAAR